MKTFKISILFILVFFISSCGTSQQRLKKIVAEMNNECPVNLGLMGTMTKVLYNEEDNSVNLYFSVSNEFMSFEEMKQNQNIMINNMKLSTSREDNKILVEDIIKAGASYSIHFINSLNPSEEMTFSLSNSEIKEQFENPLTEYEISSMMLANQLIIENSRCPYLVDEGMMMTNVRDIGNYLLYSCSLDEKLYDIDHMKTIDNDLKESLREYFSDPVMKRQIQILSNLNKGLQYEYYGNKSGKKVIVTFNPVELKEYLN